jgi:hypothetical protein
MPRRNHDFSPHVEPLCTRIAPSGLVAEAADPDPDFDPHGVRGTDYGRPDQMCRHGSGRPVRMTPQPSSVSWELSEIV